MKEKKRKEIIEAAISLFAEKGFHVASVQDIVDACDMSKGAFYNYFSSKEGLHIAIFKYYFEEMKIRLSEIAIENLDPREKFKRQLSVPFEQINRQKAFFVMYLREQSFSINKELREFMEQMQYETITWYEGSLQEIYGEKIKAYLSDVILLIEGIRNGYLGAILFFDSKIDRDLVPNFLLNRVDDIVHAFENGEEPIIKGSSLFDSFPKNNCDTIDVIEKVITLLADMKEQLGEMSIDTDQKEGLINVLGYLEIELEKANFDKYMLQGMLANLKVIQAFDIYREKIAHLLNIEVL